MKGSKVDPNDPNEVVEHDVPREPDKFREWTREEKEMAKPKPRRNLPAKTPGGGNEDEQRRATPFYSRLAQSQTGRVPDTELTPYSAVGKLFFEWKGKNWTGTAWSVGHHGLITAGHNVYEDHEWSSNVWFDLQYSDGSATGSYQVTTLYTLQGWLDTENVQYDLAACKTQQPMETEFLPIAANLDPQQIDPYTTIGYPAEHTPEFPFDGKYMWKSVGNYSAGGYESISVESSLSEGASGGPWWVKVKGQPESLVNGLTSRGDDRVNSSPYFGIGVERLYKAVDDKFGDSVVDRVHSESRLRSG